MVAQEPGTYLSIHHLENYPEGSLIISWIARSRSPVCARSFRGLSIGIFEKKKDRAWDVKREKRKAVAAGSFKELDHLQEGLKWGFAFDG